MLFAYSPDRKGIHPQTHLAGFSGVLQADDIRRVRTSCTGMAG
ncbi:cytochrome o ubiquinol oxidase, subunit I [Escherichia coli DEC10B]|nr:cytochrome o ubiquinol oxidase, subunit I [Escherichia coli DEC10B]